MLKYFLLLFSFWQSDNGKLIEQASQELTSGRRTVSDILQDKKYMGVHGEVPFRELIRANAKSDRISLVSSDEPGVPALIKCRLTGQKPQENYLVYVYHTDNKGIYGPAIQAGSAAQIHARLFGYLRPNKNGEFEFSTIHPQGYPDTDIAQHIHLEVFDSRGTSILNTELLFDDDPRLSAEEKTRLTRQFFLAKNEGSAKKQQYSYTIEVRGR